MAGKIEQVHRYVFRALRAGLFTDKIPTEAELCERFDVSHGTVRAAIKRLIDLGLLLPRKGAGVFVNKNIDSHRGRTLVASLVGEAYDSYYMSQDLALLSSIMWTLYQRRCLYLSLDEIVGEARRLAEFLPQAMPDGLLWLCPRYERINSFQNMKIPMVAVWALSDEKYRCEMADYPPEINGVFLDRFQEGYLYAKRCFEKGFDKLLVEKKSNGRELNGDLFFAGILSAFSECGLDSSKNLLHITPDKVNYSRINRAVKKGFLGVYASGSTFEFFQNFFKEAGSRHGLDHLLLIRSTYCASSLEPIDKCELIDVSLETMAREAVELLLNRIESDESEPKQILIPPRIVTCEEYENSNMKNEP